MIQAVLERVKSEPAVVAGVIAGVIVFVCGHFGIVLDKPTVTSVVTPVVLGVVTRFFVTPAASSKAALQTLQAKLASQQPAPPAK